MRRAALAAVAVAALAGCGGDGDEEERADPPSAETVALAKRCGVAPPEPGSPPDTLLPADVLPEGAIVTRWEGDQRATVLLRGSINDAFRALLGAAERAGREIVFREVEVFDAEVEVRLADGIVRFVLSPAPTCDDITRAVATRRRA